MLTVMNWTAKPHKLEVLVEWAAPMVLALAAAWAASAAGLSLVADVTVGVGALSFGILAMRTAGQGHSVASAPFEPVEFEPDGLQDELLLDDPLVEVAPDSRVVKLFAGNEPTPGELVLRISDYLSEQGKAPNAESLEPFPVDASAALHAALANIRANLR